MTEAPTVTLVTLGCARNDVDAEELAARLEADEWRLVEDGPSDVVVVNTCGFVTSAKQESIDTIIDAAGDGARVVAVGCLAERYGRELAAELPEAAAVVGFDGYDRLGDTLRRVLAGEPIPSHEPVDRRTLLPITPVLRHGHRDTPGTTSASADPVTPPGHAAVARHPRASGAAPSGVVLPGDETVLRRRLGGGPVAPLKIASGCDRRCSFCAIPSFRGAFLSRPPEDLIAEARWLAGQGVRELICVSENSTSYGKDLGEPRLLETLLPQLAAVEGIERVRVSYLQPAEMRPSLIEAIASHAGVAPYFDLSFQHASGPLLRRMRRFGDAQSFLDLIARVRSSAPEAGIRSNVILGFPGENAADVKVLEDFLAEARLDAVGVFGYSDEDGTEAFDLPDKVDPDEISERVNRIADLADLVSAERAADRRGTTARLLVVSEADASGSRVVHGHCEFQGPEDGATALAADHDSAAASPGDLIDVVITGSDGVDLMAIPLGSPSSVRSSSRTARMPERNGRGPTDSGWRSPSRLNPAESSPNAAGVWDRLGAGDAGNGTGVLR